MLVLCLAAGGCSTTGPTPQTPEEIVAHAAFQRDRAACLSVAERSWPYVDVKDARGVARRQMEVEADAQRCMLTRGWNDPKFDGWSAGRSWGWSR